MAASTASFAWSLATMKALGIAWGDESLAKILTKPMEVVLKTKMAFPGLTKPENFQNVTARLKGATK